MTAVGTPMGVIAGDHPGDQPDVDGLVQEPGRGQVGQRDRARPAPARGPVHAAGGARSWPRQRCAAGAPEGLVSCLAAPHPAGDAGTDGAPRDRPGAGHRRAGHGRARRTPAESRPSPSARATCRPTSGRASPDLGRGGRDDHHLEVVRQRDRLRGRAVRGRRRRRRRPPFLDRSRGRGAHWMTTDQQAALTASCSTTAGACGRTRWGSARCGWPRWPGSPCRRRRGCWPPS